MVIIPRIVCRVGRSLVKWIATPHGFGVREHIIGVGPIIGLASDIVVGYPHMIPMVKSTILVEMRLVAPIWKNYSVMSKVIVVATPSVVIGPITTHNHILVVVEALSSWTVWRVVCATIGVSFVGIGLGMVGLHIALWSLPAIHCLLESTKHGSGRCLEVRRCPQWPCLWLTFLRLWMHPFVSRLQGRVCSPYVYCVLSVNIFTWDSIGLVLLLLPMSKSFRPLILASWPAPVLWVASEDHLAMGGLGDSASSKTAWTYPKVVLPLLRIIPPKLTWIVNPHDQEGIIVASTFCRYKGTIYQSLEEDKPLTSLGN
eukprot:Gb_27029 [translate_table: standard]